MMSERELRIRMDDDDDLRAAHDTAKAQKVDFREVVPPLKPEVIEPVSAIIVGALAAKFIVDWWDRRKGGLVIDLRPKAEDEIYRNPDVPFGYVIIFAPEGGKVTVEVKDAPKDAWERLVSDVIEGAFGSVSAVAEAAGKVVGTDKVKRDDVSDAERS